MKWLYKVVWLKRCIGILPNNSCWAEEKKKKKLGAQTPLCKTKVLHSIISKSRAIGLITIPRTVLDTTAYDCALLRDSTYPEPRVAPRTWQALNKCWVNNSGLKSELSGWNCIVPTVTLHLVTQWDLLIRMMAGWRLSSPSTGLASVCAH